MENITSPSYMLLNIGPVTRDSVPGSDFFLA